MSHGLSIENKRAKPGHVASKMALKPGALIKTVEAYPTVYMKLDDRMYPECMGSAGILFVRLNDGWVCTTKHLDDTFVVEVTGKLTTEEL